ncbi:hypothetical protein [Nonomuraea longispora]|uniref:hypothetical protein n=1 Tax=Nonomuraea longispora TaxID=1848320 RepID=UPI0015F2CC55|nr:hypothetical protein [Nonomuraea longispora]
MSPPVWTGSARAVEVTAPAVLEAFESDSGSHLFRNELTEVVRTRVEGDELVMDAWRDGAGVRQIRRK